MSPQDLRSRLARDLAAICGVICMLAAGSGGAASAKNLSLPHNFVGWVWGEGANSCYTPDTAYSFNSQNGSIQICPAGNGVYEVEFGSLYHGQPDDVQVSAYNTSGYCVSDGWGYSGSTVVAYVACYDGGGNPQNEFFTLLYQARTRNFGTTEKGIAFLWADQPTGGTYTPNLSYQYNSTGGTNTVQHNNTGQYTVTIPGLDYRHSDVQVTAYGAAAHCKATYWDANENGGTDIDVECFNGAGNFADEYYELAYAVEAPFGLTTPAHSKGAWGYADDDTNTSVYTLDPYYQYNGFHSGKLTAQKLGTGEYAVYLPGALNYATSNVLVTAGGNSGYFGNYCNIEDWQSSAIYVLCYHNGNLSDSTFDVSFQTAE